MGFAASQARLLLLTARKSDLEFRAQQITNAEMALARQTETIATEYARKLSNQTLKVIAKGEPVPFTASTLSSLSNGGYKLQEKVDGTWQDWVSIKAPATGTFTDSDDSSAVMDDSVETPVPIDADGSQSPTTSGSITQTPVPTPDASDITETIDPTVIPPLNDGEGDNGTEGSGSITNNYTGAQILQGIANGTLRIVDANGNEIDPNSNVQFTVCYDTSDDAEADAKYRSETAALQVKEKRLQMELQQVEAQQKACDAEIESVKKIMDKNIDKTFKVFS